MRRPVKNVAVLGSTGSIGTKTLEVIAASDGRHRAHLLSAHTRVGPLLQQAHRVRPRWIVVTDLAAAKSVGRSDLPPGTELLCGPEGIEKAICHQDGRNDTDIVVAAIVGSAGLKGTWAALEAGKRVALANKETLVVAGPLAMDLAVRKSATLIPVDSEHSAVFQVIHAGGREHVERIVLTASGGPFREQARHNLENVTIEEALAHPIWDMGPKITVDSATMMNKALEIIEARWLFRLSADQIDVVVHPQSVVHSLVEFVDGSVIAQLSPPDMKLPIQFALDYPNRYPGVAQRLDLTKAWNLDFEPADFDRFPALGLGLEAARAGGTTGAVLNAANEAAVARFLEGDLRFTEIVTACRSVLEAHVFDPNPTLQDLFKLDRWAREEVSHYK